MSTCSIRHPLCRIRSIATFFSALVLLFFAAASLVRGFNWGIDIVGGVNIEIRTDLSVNELRTRLRDTVSFVQERGTKGRESRFGLKAANFEKLEEAKIALGNDVIYDKIETVGPQLGSSTFRIFLTLVLVMLAVTWCALSVSYGSQYAKVGTIGIIHDILWIFGLYSILGLEVGELFFVTILIVIAYSVNDTIVIFQAIKERVAQTSALDTQQTVWEAILGTLTRTTLTSFTTIIALFPMCFCGPQLFCMAFTLIVGILVGTYSSICLVAPYLALYNLD